MPTMAIRNAGFSAKRKVSAFNEVRQYFNLVFKVNKLKTKYKLLATCRFENSAFQIPHYA